MGQSEASLSVLGKPVSRTAADHGGLTAFRLSLRVGQLIKTQIIKQLRGPKISRVCGRMEQDTPAEPRTKDTKSAKSMTRLLLLR